MWCSMKTGSPDDEAVLAAANEAALAAAKRHHIQKALDEALADSFPASDPVSIVTSQARRGLGVRVQAARLRPLLENREALNRRAAKSF